MPGELPLLYARDLKGELSRLHRVDHRSLTTAFWGRQAPDVPSEIDVVVERHGEQPITFPVVEARCEWEVRRALTRTTPQRLSELPGGTADGASTALVLLLDFPNRDKLPFDITSRLASGKVREIPEDQRVARLFRAQAVSADVMASPGLKKALLDVGSDFGSAQGVTVDLETAWRQYLAQAAALPEDTPLSEERLLIHVAGAPDPYGFRGVLAQQPQMREELLKFLADRAGPVALLSWRAWEAGTGVEAAAWAFLLQALLPVAESNGFVASWLEHRLGAFDAALAGGVAKHRSLLERWAKQADRLYLHLGAGSPLFKRVVAAADAALTSEPLQDAAAESRYLTVAVSRGKARLASRLDEARRAPDPARLAALTRELQRLDDHVLAGDQAEAGLTGQRQRARMAARLLGWMAAEVAAPATAALPTDVVAELGTRYARDGGFVDWARSHARGPQTSDPLDAAIAAVVEAADRLRDEHDERFARALPAWLERRKSDRVVPIDEALDRFAVPFLAGNKDRKLLVLLLDGMSWANAAELLIDLENYRWGPLRWQPAGTSGDLLPPMFAALPTLTRVSRTAFFSGRLPDVGELRDTTTDPDRFDGHSGLRKLLGHGPRLLMRKDAVDRAGQATAKGLGLLREPDRVVGVVFNAIDDGLSLPAGPREVGKVADILALSDYLTAAAQAGRAVLLVADHGHIHDRLGVIRNARGTGLDSARARELGPDETPADHEVGFEGPAAWRRKKAHRLALLFRETDTYGTIPHRGTHGGAALSEVVTPAILIGAEELAENASTVDRDLDVRAFPRPLWWDLERLGAVPQAAASTPSSPTAPPRKKVEDKPVRQLTLPHAAPPTAVVGTPEVAAGPTRWETLLRGSVYYREAPKKEQDFWGKSVIPVVDRLLEHDGKMNADALAVALKLPVFRMASVLAEVAARLNVDQHPVLTFDRAKGQVFLQLILVEQIFSE
jgi:hypothetical protein